MKKYICSFLVLASGLAMSQTILNSKSPDDFRKLRAEGKKVAGDSVISVHQTPIEYGYVNENDIIKSVMVWEIIDLNDKINQPLYIDNPDGLANPSRSLYNVLLQGALTGEIKEIYDDENFVTKLSPEAIQKRLEKTVLNDAAVDILNSGRELTESEKQQYIDTYRTTTDKVRLLKIMGMWYLDKRDGQLKYRPLGISAMGPDPAVQGVIGPDGQPIAGKDDLIDLFWVYYPDARDILANNYVFTRNDASSDMSFDDIINSRRFSTVIYKSSNGLGDGTISDYIPNDADEQMEESEQIKSQILAMENEMWNY